MSFLRLQNLKRDENGVVINGSASLMQTVYDKQRLHKSYQEVVEKLGKILWYDEKANQIIVFSDSRGVVGYDNKLKTFFDVPSSDKRVSHYLAPEKEEHFVFGQMDMLLSFMKNESFTELLSTIFPKDSDFERVLSHLTYSVLRYGSKIKCDDFISSSTLCHYIRNISISSLASDTLYFKTMGEDSIKKAFFKAFIKKMQKRFGKSFGTGCFVDSTPLPNDIDSPFCALSSHGLSGSSKQMRMILILESNTLLPMWYEIIPGNVVDISTLDHIRLSITEALDIKIKDFTLDAGYCSKSLIEAFCPVDDDLVEVQELSEEDIDNNNNEDDSVNKSINGSMIVRMPARKGYPYKTLYNKYKDQIPKGKYAFALEDHIYFGKRCTCNIFNRKVYAYVYVDRKNANASFIEYLEKHSDEFYDMKDKDKDFRLIEGGYFVLLSNIEISEKDMLALYFKRTGIESFFKTSKTYLELLPLSKWSDKTVRGKILSDMISSIIFIMLRERANESGLSMSSLLGALSGYMAAFRGKDRKLIVDVPSKRVKEIYKAFNLPDSNSQKSTDYFQKVGLRI